MSETLNWKEHKACIDGPDEDGNSSGMTQERPDGQSERPKSPSINVAPTPLNEEGIQPATGPASGKQSDERIEDLVSLFRDFLEAAPNKAVSTGSSHPIAQQNKAGRKRFFGIAKDFSPETGSNNRYDYEQKYPRDRFGKEVSNNSRVWLTYLDEAESFDRERVEGWKETVDVLLVFAGLFSGVITTFISQASQNLQQDNTQVSASLLFAIAQILLAQSNGIPANIPLNSMMNPSSPFTPNTNAVLVNGLWFTSLAITLSVALFAVLAKQWLYYYLSSISGTANEKVRARQLRFNGFESWKVAAIVDLLPILLHLAVGLFLTGIIILLFPLDVHVAWTIVVIAGITFTLYFVSVMLPIWYPECPYTTSLTIYIGILFFILRQTFQKITGIINKGFKAIWRNINSKARHTVVHLVLYGQSLVRHGFMFSSMLAGAAGRGFERFRSTIFSDKLPGFTKWREENIKKAIENTTSLDYEALKWLYATSQNRSVHRIIARCAAVHPIIKNQFGSHACWYLRHTLEISETNVVDIRYGLCLDIDLHNPRMRAHWKLLLSIPDVVESQLEEGECQTYLHFAKKWMSGDEPKRQTLLDAINGTFNLPLIIWSSLLNESTDTTVAVHILAYKPLTLFPWDSNPTRELIHNAGLVYFGSIELVWWRFEYLFRYFELGTPDCSSEAKTYGTCYLLLITIYRNLTSDDPMITDKGVRQESLTGVLRTFDQVHLVFTGRLRTLEDALRFFREICCVDSFWCESMTNEARIWAALTLGSMNLSISYLEKSLPFTDSHDLSLIYQWYSRDLGSELSYYTSHLLVLLLVPQNRHHLSTILLTDPDPVSHFSKCLHNLANHHSTDEDKTLCRVLMDLLKSVGSKDNTLHAILYDPSVLSQLWKLLVYCQWETQRYFLLVKSKINRESLDKLFAAMNELVRSLDDLENLPLVCQRDKEYTEDVRSALAASAREFGQLIGQPEASADQSAFENGPSNNDHNDEERAQVPVPDERITFNSIGNWMKKTSESIWLRMPRKTSNQSNASPIALSEMNSTLTA